MNIAFFIKKTTFHKGFGGMETQNKILVEGLTAKGHTVTVFSPKWELTELHKSQNGVNYIFVESNYRYFLSKFYAKSWYNRSYQEFLAIHANRPFDVALSQSSAGLGIIDRKNRIGIKVISIAHGSAMGELWTYINNYGTLQNFSKVILNVQYALRQFFGRQRSYVLHSNKVVAVSNAVKRQLISETFIDENNICVIHNGISPFEVVTIKALPDKPINLVYTGQLTKDKGVELFEYFAKDARFKNFCLHIFGGGALEDFLRALSTMNMSGATIKMYGKLDYSEYINILIKLGGGIFVFPTRRIEGFPMVLVEAMMAGLAPVAYDIGGNSDAVDSTVGALIPFENKKAFLDKVVELSSEPDKLINVCAAARDKALKNFTTDIMLNNFEKLIKEVTSK